MGVITNAASAVAKLVDSNISRIRQAAKNAVAAGLAMDRPGQKLIGRRERYYHVKVYRQKFVANSPISIIQSEVFFKYFRDYWKSEKRRSRTKYTQHRKVRSNIQSC